MLAMKKPPEGGGVVRLESGITPASASGPACSPFAADGGACVPGHQVPGRRLAPCDVVPGEET
jgi:hypothetical protein